MGFFMEKASTASKKIINSVNSYINQLHDHYSKLLILRVDLGYSKEHGKNISLSDMKRDAKHLLDNRRSNHALFEHQVGYVMKFEYTAEKGPHIHAIFAYDGQHVRKDAHLGDQIGSYWNEPITDGKGVYHNCNRDKKHYRHCGIGMVDHSDIEKRSALTNKVIPYLLKSEQSIDEIKSDKERSVTRGVAPSVKSNAGRPRSKGTSYR